ncbi:MAG: hypothetical protein SH848_15920, partial [Saprospiraceae bacterium]|nr:hypothetical protein [Saprospiraceae bacterium]
PWSFYIRLVATGIIAGWKWLFFSHQAAPSQQVYLLLAYRDFTLPRLSQEAQKTILRTGFYNSMPPLYVCSEVFAKAV